MLAAVAIAALAPTARADEWKSEDGGAPIEIPWQVLPAGKLALLALAFGLNRASKILE